MLPIDHSGVFPETRWEQRAFACKRDLTIKKVAVAIIALLNLAALGVALYFVIAYCPLPTQALLASPFIIGVIAALTYMGYDTFGVSTYTYTYLSNPTVIIGKGLTYAFFGPLALAVKHLDWTAYHDPFVANKISNDLENQSFEEIANKYGRNFENLIKYGMISEQNKHEILDLYKKHKVVQRALDFYERERLSDSLDAEIYKAKKRKIEMNWKDFKSQLIFSKKFPHPEMPEIDFSKLTTRIRLKLRELWCTNDNPLKIFGFPHTTSGSADS